jgi:hypothetical protein
MGVGCSEDSQIQITQSEYPHTLAKFNLLQLLPAAFAIAEKLSVAEMQFEAGQPVSVTIGEVRTYIGGQHVGIDIGPLQIKPL